MTSLRLACASIVALATLSAGSAFALDRTAAQRQADGDAFRASHVHDETGNTPSTGSIHFTARQGGGAVATTSPSRQAAGDVFRATRYSDQTLGTPNLPDQREGRALALDRAQKLGY
ncbi:MAG: hypothetical protein K2X51_11775 [Burkholderiales bacterium]|nr:hypothetical protein [Burkholderiales bacterium]